ncbi:hypothetical protein K435DRAFT_876059 [Dendrothele bispora CBS 962.96]|uniref:Myb/SANT-like domain-containing protein n=1 Tax=Dendrothele bispora (strain CBS 962.96) TaxID=1314807 RepID=A0A4S8KSZ5_DENBC|nr:hypothetical protein K435DRAFT_876059 [Dendrothele bispora CBS 962.96]
MEQPTDKENQPPVEASTNDAASVKKKRGRPLGSKNKPKEQSEGVHPTKTPAKTKKKTKSDEPQTDEKPKTTRPRAIYTEEDDTKLMQVFLEHKGEGNGTDNGGWKGKALKAAEKALEGSELESGGAPKSVSSIRDHWDHLKAEFAIFKSLVEKSGWGWDDE